MNLRENYNHLKSEAYVSLKKRESSKSWIRMLEVTPILLGSMTRGRLLLAVNAAERILDNIADRDRQPPQGISRLLTLKKSELLLEIRKILEIV